MADCIYGAGKIEDVSGVFSYETKQKDSTSRISTQRLMSEGHGSQLEGALTGQISDNLNIKYNSHCN